MLDIIPTMKKEVVPNETVVRIYTAYRGDRSSLHVKRTISLQKRKSSGCNMLFEDASEMPVAEVIQRITNLAECEDGLYRVVTHNEKRDWETGIVDDYDYLLVPFKEGE